MPKDYYKIARKTKKAQEELNRINNKIIDKIKPNTFHNIGYRLFTKETKI